ncbi:hypothetical protein N7466_009984 [Penicillium verhagenii]|uniref:uncharacterized protein n=1 Tax=Penicillium verhagenii TaxID=1562060 RepID=UPI002544E1AB|nr:uncharacterized protein N7466_009984 [Penicillium verhagenii]KAJ5919041.1 hypothetical protein N7466_009984 [Penicillium verhagenii]
MAEENPVTSPGVAEQPEHAPTADKPTDKELDAATTSDTKPSENANNTDEKETEGQTDKSDAVDDATKAQEEAESASADAEAEAQPNGTPASVKKSAKDRRRSSGVGEKKLNRKKSQTRITHLDAKPGQYYLARLRSYAPWPAVICDEEMLPQSLLDTRPVTAMQADGTYRADYAEEGRRAHERTFPVMFFETNEFAWITNTNLTPLDPAECKDISEKNKTKQLIGAFKVASEGHDLEHFKSLLNDHQAALQQEIEDEEREEEEKAKAKADKEAEKANKKNKRKSKGAETDVEMEDVEAAKPSKATKKRKKDETDVEEDKPAKTPKTATKIKLSTPKAPKTPVEDKKKAPAPKTKKAAPKKGKAAASDEEPVEAKEPEKQIDPEELKKKKEKEVLFLRHKLQKGFISRDNPPQGNEMDAMATYFDKLEKHADLEVAIIRSTKINKVLKMIVKLNTIPRDEEFNFRSRAMNLLSSWKTVLEGDLPILTDKEDKPASNGASKDDEALETPAEDDKEDSKADDTPMPDAESDKPEPQPEASKEESDEKAE